MTMEEKRTKAIIELGKENERLKAQIEKMKCCSNCVFNNYCNKEHYGMDKCDKWELAE